MSSKIKYQIFVSSTYEDLKEERELVIKAILEMGHIPVGMEMFSAGDEQQWKLIQRQIDDCDYYIVVVAQRYGSMDAGMGYTEKEYDYAVLKKLPVLGFVLQNPDWPVSKSDTETIKNEKLASFKNKIKQKIISYWSNKEDLSAKVSIALGKQFAANPGVGWIKANEVVGPQVLTEITRLSTENSKLREELDVLTKKDELDDLIKYDEIFNILRSNSESISFYYKNGKDWEDATNYSYSEIFEILAPELMVEKSTQNAAIFLAQILNYDKINKLRDEFPMPSNLIRAILANLASFGLVMPSIKKNRSVKDSNEYWRLTEEGTKLYHAFVRRRFKANAADLANDESKQKEVTEIKA